MSTLGYLICIPFAWLVRVFYNMTGSYGVAIILFTLVVKLIMLPFQIKSKKGMLRMSRLNGKMQEIQKKYANNRAKMNEETMKLYEEEGANPMSGCLWSFLPLPILIALYSIIRQPITRFMMVSEEAMHSAIKALQATGMNMESILQHKAGEVVMASNGLPTLTPYGQIHLVRELGTHLPEYAEGIEGWINVNYNFLGLNLTDMPWETLKGFNFSWACIGVILIPILAGLSQLVMSKVTIATTPQSGDGTGRTMMYMMPLMSVYIAFIMPAALGVYWIAQSVFSLIQEVIMNKFFLKKMEAEETARYEARQADRERRQKEAREQQKQWQNTEPKKLTLKEKQQAAQAAKAAKAAQGPRTNEAGRVGDRPYARGRSYQADRYDN